MSHRALSVLILTLAAQPLAAGAQSTSYELKGKIYTKWMYKNDASRGCLSLSNPFWSDNIGGSNGACSELDLTLTGRVSKWVVGRNSICRLDRVAASLAGQIRQRDVAD